MRGIRDFKRFFFLKAWNGKSTVVPVFISESINFVVGTYPIYTSYFLQAGLKIPFDPLLADFLRKTKHHISQLAPKSVRTILGITEINR